MAAILLVTLAVPLLLLYLLWRYSYWYRRGVPQGNPLKLFGDLNDLQITSMKYCQYYLALSRKFPDKPFFGVYSASVPSLMIRDEEILKDIFTRKFNNFGSNGYEVSEDVDPIVARDPFFQPNGEKWKETRTFFSSLMTPGRLRNMFSGMVEASKETVNYLKEHQTEEGRGDGVNIKKVATRSMTNLLVRLSLSLEAGCFKPGENAFLNAEKELFEQWMSGLSFALFISPKIGRLLGLRFIPESIVKFYTKIIRDQQAYRSSNGITQNDILDLMMKKSFDSKDQQDGKSGKGLTGLTKAELDVIAVIIMFIVEGFETTSTNIATTIVELARHPEIQETLRQEILNVCPLGTDISDAVINDIPLLHNCLLEGLRIYPPLLILQRKVTENVTLEAKTGEKISLKTGETVHIPLFAIQRDPEYFPDPEKFIPDRFEDENQKRILIGFGDGPRQCPGQRFALQASKILLATILREFKLELSPKTKVPLEPINNMVLFSIDEIWVRFVPA